MVDLAHDFDEFFGSLTVHGVDEALGDIGQT